MKAHSNCRSSAPQPGRQPVIQRYQPPVKTRNPADVADLAANPSKHLRRHKSFKEVIICRDLLLRKSSRIRIHVFEVADKICAIRQQRRRGKVSYSDPFSPRGRGRARRPWRRSNRAARRPLAGVVDFEARAVLQLLGPNMRRGSSSTHAGRHRRSVDVRRGGEAAGSTRRSAQALGCVSGGLSLLRRFWRSDPNARRRP